jgi:hypothetical protein
MPILNIRGMDINPDLAKVAKMHMVLYDDGHIGIFAENAMVKFQIFYLLRDAYNF